MSIANGYASLAQIRSELGNYAVADTSDDSKLEMSVEAASRMIDGWCGQRFWIDSTVTARQFVPDDTHILDLSEVDGIATATGLLVKLDTDDSGTYETSLTIDTDFLLRPFNAVDGDPDVPFTEIVMTGTTYQFGRSSYGRATVEITAKWGWPAVPTDVTKACLIVAIDLFKSKDAAFGIAGGNEFGALRVTSGLPRLAQALLTTYRRPAVG